MNAWQLTVSLLRETFLVVDQALNAIGLGLLALAMSIVTGKPQNPAYSDETLSAHAWRAAQRNKRWGRLFRPFIDLLFFWQKPDPTITDENGPIKGHCKRAFLKEKLKRGLPPEYRD